MRKWVKLAAQCFEGVVEAAGLFGEKEGMGTEGGEAVPVMDAAQRL